MREFLGNPPLTRREMMWLGGVGGIVVSLGAVSVYSARIAWKEFQAEQNGKIDFSTLPSTGDKDVLTFNEDAGYFVDASRLVLDTIVPPQFSLNLQLHLALDGALDNASDIGFKGTRYKKESDEFIKRIFSPTEIIDCHFESLTVPVHFGLEREFEDKERINRMFLSVGSENTLPDIDFVSFEKRQKIARDVATHLQFPDVREITEQGDSPVGITFGSEDVMSEREMSITIPPVGGMTITYFPHGK